MGFETHFLFAAGEVDKEAIINDVEQTLAEGMPDVEVVDVEVGGAEGNRILRVFVDHPEGVNHDLCMRVTGLLERYLKDYTVEVSSPGLERRLRKLEHFQAAVGKKINVRTFGPVEGSRSFTGFLVSADGENIVLDEEGRSIIIPLNQVSRARTVFEFGGQKKPRPGRSRKKRR